MNQRKTDKGIRKWSSSILAVAAVLAAFGGAVAWTDARYVTAAVYAQEREQAAIQRAAISKTVLNIELRQIESELYDREAQMAKQPSDILASRIRQLKFDKARIMRDLDD